MPQSLNGSCACSTSGTAAAKELYPGLAEADLSTIEITQGVPWTWRQCFVKSVKPVQILEERVGGQIVVAKSEHCYAVGDRVRLINYNSCLPDTNDAIATFPVATIITNPANIEQDIITLTGLTTIAKVYTAAAATSAFVPVGCKVGTTTAAASLPPYTMEVCDGAPLFITGGITARDDYYQMFSVASTAGSPILYSTELGKVQVGDYIKSAAIGFANPVRVLRVDMETVQDSLTGARMQREKITLSANATTTSNCAAIEVCRGIVAPLRVTQSGDCWELTISGGATRSLQMPKALKQGNAYNLGTLTVTAFFGTLSGGKLVTRGVELLRSNVLIKPSHMGV